MIPNRNTIKTYSTINLIILRARLLARVSMPQTIDYVMVSCSFSRQSGGTSWRLSVSTPPQQVGTPYSLGGNRGGHIGLATKGGEQTLFLHLQYENYGRRETGDASATSLAWSCNSPGTLSSSPTSGLVLAQLSQVSIACVVTMYAVRQRGDELIV